MVLKLSLKLTEVSKNGTIIHLGSDGKTQVTVEYKEEKSGKMISIRVQTILISTQHDPELDNETIEKEIKKYFIQAVISPEILDDKTQYHINPRSKFIIGGPEAADAELTERKIIVDKYRCWRAHGVWAFSGKGPSKVDRSGAYAARWIAKSLVARGLCDKALVQITYSIGITKPLSIFINTYGNN